MKRQSIRQPVSGGVARTPVVMQMEALECGAACLTMVLAYYGKWIPLERVRIDCGVCRDGSNAKNMLRAARNYGLDARGLRMEPEALREYGTFPCIIHWNFNHFVVLRGFRGNHAYLNDPARGSLRVTMEEFDQAFTGVCLCFEPSEGFEPSGKRRSMLSFARKRLSGTGRAALFVLLTALIGYLFTVINPAFTRFFMDRLLTGENRELLIPFIVLMAAAAGLQVLVAAIQGIYSLKINGRMAMAGAGSFFWKILHLPMSFFSQRMAGDIQLRQSDNADIAKTLVETVAPLGVSAIMVVFYLAVMLRYSPLLTLVGLASVALNLFMSRLISAKRVNVARVQMRDEGKLAAATVSGIQMAETIKAAGAETGFFRRWAGYQASVNRQATRYAAIDRYLGAIPAFVSTLANAAVLVLGIRLCMRGHFTLGMVTAFQSYLLAFMNPAMTMITAGQTIQEMRTKMERVEDVMEYPDDPLTVETPLREEESCEKLRGEVELRNVCFGYSPLGEPLIRDFSMHLQPGSRVALVGGSGCGKSTVARLISGMCRPWSGEILFDGKPMEEIDRSVFTGSVAMVDQDIVLFADTVANNIKMWDSSIEDFEMILAARDARIHDDIMQRPGGYQGTILEGGHDLSGGQRQRLEIARVLAQDPHVIILDEATSALDARTEYELVRAVRDRGITCIVIAHRLSTIRDCDEILVMERGSVAERGTHDELIALGGRYAELIAND